MNITEGGQEPPEARLTGITIDQESMTAGFKGNACAIIAEALGEQLYSSGAENYIEMRFTSGKYPDGGELVVTLQRCTGKTPHQLREKAERERDALLDGELESARDVFSLVNRNTKLVSFLRELRDLGAPHPQRDRINQVLEQLLEENQEPVRAEFQALRADKARLDSGRIITSERNEFGDSYQCERVGVNLRASIDAAMALDASDRRRQAAQ